MAQVNSYVGSEKLRLGFKQKEMLKNLIEMGVDITNGIPMHKLVPALARSKYYKIVVFIRAFKLQQKGLIDIRPSGKRGGKMVFFTPEGYQLAQKLAQK